MRFSLLALALAGAAHGASLLAVDYGTDAFKAALVKPGVPFDVLINADSKRKTPAIVALRATERSFGGAAVNLVRRDDDVAMLTLLQATRFPRDTFSAVKLLLGGAATSAQAQLHRSLYPAAGPPATTTRGSPALSSSTTSYAVEEVLAMQLAYAKETAEGVAGEQVREALVTVPSWFGQSERVAVLDAVELAGLRCIGLVNDGTAAAVNYAMTRTFPPTPSYHLLYDFGAGSLRTTLVSLKSALLPDPLSLAAKPTLQNVTSLVVHGVGYDTNVGGFVFDQIIRDIMKEDFEKAHTTDVSADGRAMAKLLKEASRVKHVLSANVASIARIEGLVGDVDFRTTVTREQLEARSASRMPRFVQPIHDALASANLTLADVESVIMIGGSSRVPMVEAAVRGIVGEEKIAKNVNADEAAVMGAALYGAGITRGFRTKDIRVQDITPFGIDVSYEADGAPVDGEARTIKTHLFPALSKLGAKKTMSFKKRADFALHFGYARQDDADAHLPTDLFETTITGLTAALVNLTEEAIANATIKVTIELSESNVVSVTKAVVILTEESSEPAPTMNDRLKGFLGKFGGKASEDASSAEPSASAKPDKDAADASEAELAASKAELEELLKNMAPKNATVRLGLSTVPLERMPMTQDDKSEARKRLREIKTAETRKLAREEARNVLEAYIYKVRDLVENAAFVEASTAEEREVIKSTTESSNEWLWEEADEASTKELKSKKSDLEKLVKHVSVRSTEATQRPDAIVAFLTTLSSARDFVTSATANATIAESLKETPRFTTLEIESLSTLVANASEWLEGKLKLQEGVKAHEDAVLRVSDIEKKVKEVESELAKLARKKAPRKAKIPKKAKAVKVEEEPVVEEPIPEKESAPEGEKLERAKDEL